MIQRNCVSPVNSSMLERASGWRRSAFEKKMARADSRFSRGYNNGEVNAARLTLPELAVHLPTKDMEKVGWRCHVSNLHIAVLMLSVELVLRREDARVFVAELKIALEASR